MPLRAGPTYETQKGFYNPRKRTFSGRGQAPAGSRKVKAPALRTTPTITSHQGHVLSVTGFPSRRAASNAVRQQRSSRARLGRIEHLLGIKRPPLAPRLSEGRRSPPTVSPGVSERVSLPRALPSSKPAVFQGHKTLGAPTLRELRVSQRSGTLGTTAKGYVTTPAVRKATGTLHQLESMRRGGPLPGLGPSESHVARQVLSQGLGATRKQKLAAVETGLVESGFRNLPGGTSDSQGWRQERASIFPNPRNVKAGARRFFSEAREQPGATAGELAANVQRPAEQYRGRYQERKPQALAILGAYEHGSLKPAQQHKLEQARAQARHLGLKVAPPDISLSPDPRFVFVRADANAAVQWAQHALGTAEGSGKQLRWAAEEGLGGTQPWCANFVSADLKRHGVPLPPNPNYVPSYEREWSGGRNIGTNLAHAKPGDLIAYSGDHIGIYKGNGKIISGNYSNEVAESNASEGPAPISAILRPSYKGGRIKVRAGTPLPSYIGGTSVTSVPAGTEAALAVSAAQEQRPRLTRFQKAEHTLRRLEEVGAPVSLEPLAPEDKGAVLEHLERTYGKKAV